MTASLPLSASIREMATSRVALKSRKLLVAVPATMLLPPRPSIDRLADRQPAHVDPVVSVAADHDVMAIAAIEQVVAVGGTRDGEGIIAGAADRKRSRLNSSHSCATRLPPSESKKKRPPSTIRA